MKPIYCSFCAKRQTDVRKLIVGPSVFICNECVDLCHDICHAASAADIEYESWITAINRGNK